MNTSYKFSLDKIKVAYLSSSENGKGNKYVMLYKSIKANIINKDIPFNWLIPSSRILSKELGISRTTVNKAYELLQLEKLVESKLGSGYRVSYQKRATKEQLRKKSKSINSAFFPEISEKGKAFTKNISLVNKSSNNFIAFRPGLPPLDAFPANQWQKLLNAYWRHIKSSSLSYSSATGLEELKSSVADYLNVSRGIKCNSDQIVIVSGSLQSLYLIATTLINKNDQVVLENPVFPNVHSVFKSSEAKLIPVELDSEGINIDSLKKLKLNPKLIHVTPSNHYPLGTKMSFERRQKLLAWASKNKAMIIENDYENEIANQNLKIPSIYNLDEEGRTIYMGTFNRLLHPSIRLGYMIVPGYLIETVKALQEHSHKFVSPSIQVVMTQFIRKNYLYQHIKNIISTANDRFSLFCTEFNVISKYLYIDAKTCSSFHVIAKLKNQTESHLEDEILTKLRSIDLEAHALSKCYIGPKKSFGIILGYSAERTLVMMRKIKAMKGII